MTGVQTCALPIFESQLIRETILDKEDLDTGAFRENGGFKTINTIFQGNLETLLEDIKKSIYPDEQHYA